MQYVNILAYQMTHQIKWPLVGVEKLFYVFYLVFVKDIFKVLEIK